MRIIPAIDIINGKCVRLTKGDYRKIKTYNEDPLAVAKTFEDAGIQYLHVVDLDGAKSKHIVNQKTLESICSKTKLTVDFGGGIKTDEDLKIAFESGAHQITIGSVAVTSPTVFEKWLNQFGSSKIILGADCINRKIATQGWLDNSNLDVIEFIQKYEKKGIQQVICTDINKDGMLEGPSFESLQDIINKTTINLIASGRSFKI
ncbi:UNVERIFIED_CONTAM: hypothetical protein GTU68_015387 [Idotea baltica]|nr:hypothetical protein [Idotea baltica]